MIPVLMFLFPLAVLNILLGLGFGILYLWGRNEQAPRLARLAHDMFYTGEEDEVSGSYVEPWSAVTMQEVKPRTKKMQGAPPASFKNNRPELFWLLREIEVHLHFAPVVKDNMIYVSKRQFDKLEQYCAFAFDIPEHAKAVFGYYGLLIRVHKQ